MKSRWLSEDDLVTVNGTTRVRKVRGGVEGHANGTGGTRGNPIRRASRDQAALGKGSMPMTTATTYQHIHTVQRQNREPVSSPAHALSFVLSGQMQSGKNRILITRTGHRYPPVNFVEFRRVMIGQILEQSHHNQSSIYYPKPLTMEMSVSYVAGDRRRRDVPGMLDALMHILERAQIIEDDAQIRHVAWQELGMDRQRPRVTMTLRPTLTATTGRSRRGPEGGEET